MAAVIDLRSGLALVKVDDNRRRRILTEAVQETNYFSNIFFRFHVRVLLEAWLKLKIQLALKGQVFAGGTPVQLEWLTLFLTVMMACPYHPRPE